jgi:hypothetical protein
MTSGSKISKICIQDLIESTACGVVSDRTSEFGFEPSPASSLFFGVFLGAMMLVIKREYLLQKRRRNLS